MLGYWAVRRRGQSWRHRTELSPLVSLLAQLECAPCPTLVTCMRALAWTQTSSKAARLSSSSRPRAPPRAASTAAANGKSSKFSFLPCNIARSCNRSMAAAFSALAGTFAASGCSCHKLKGLGVCHNEQCPASCEFLGKGYVCVCILACMLFQHPSGWIHARWEPCTQSVSKFSCKTDANCCCCAGSTCSRSGPTPSWAGLHHGTLWAHRPSAISPSIMRKCPSIFHILAVTSPKEH